MNASQKIFILKSAQVGTVFALSLSLSHNIVRTFLFFSKSAGSASIGANRLFCFIALHGTIYAAGQISQVSAPGGVFYEEV